MDRRGSSRRRAGAEQGRRRRRHLEGQPMAAADEPCDCGRAYRFFCVEPLHGVVVGVGRRAGPGADGAGEVGDTLVNRRERYRSIRGGCKRAAEQQRSRQGPQGPQGRLLTSSCSRSLRSRPWRSRRPCRRPCRRRLQRRRRPSSPGPRPAQA